MSMIDWTTATDEQVVRAAVEDSVRAIESDVGGWFISAGMRDGREYGYSRSDDPAEAWKEARQHFRVRTFEAQHNPGKAPEPAQERNQLPGGCGYQGYEFGAGTYPASLCCGGRLYDADNCDNDGNLYEPAEEVPCPICHQQDAVLYWQNRKMNSGSSKREATLAARSLVGDIRRNRGIQESPNAQ